MAKCSSRSKKGKGSKSKKSGKRSSKKSAGKQKQVKSTGKKPADCRCPPGSAPIGGGVKKNRKRPQKPQAHFHYFIHKVLEQEDGDLSISKKAMDVMNSFMNDVFENIASQAAQMMKCATRKGRRTMTQHDIQAAVKILIHGELGQHAVAEGTKAVALSSGGGGGKKK